MTIDHSSDNRIALITGASRGTGRECALALARRGYDVALNYLSNREEVIKTQHAAQSYGIRALCVRADVSDKRQVDRLVRTVLDKFGHIDVLVNNAGVAEIKAVEDIDEVSWNRVMDVNLKGVLFCSQAVLKHMKNRREGLPQWLIF